MNTAELASLVRQSGNDETPLGSVSVVQEMISRYAADATAFSAMFEEGIPVLRGDSIVDKALAFLSPPLKSPNERRAARKHQLRVLEGQQAWPDLASVANTTSLICADGQVDTELPPQLYRGENSELVGWNGFSNLLTQLINVTCAHTISSTKGMPELRQSALATVLFELFKNTHDHARHELTGAQISSSIRGIYAKYYDADKIDKFTTASKKEAQPLPAGHAYCRAAIQPPLLRGQANTSPGLGALGVLEISIFDSGPGMAARWEGHNVGNKTPTEQFANVINCLTKGNSSTSSSSRGFGLWKVLRAVEEVNGFIRFRTNGVNGFRRFDSMAYSHTAQTETLGQRPTPVESLLDWQKGFSRIPSQYPEIRGTVVSLLVPMVAT